MTRRTALLLVLVGCKSPDLAMEYDGGRIDADDPDAGAFPGLVVVPNLDDDDQDGVRDARGTALAPSDDDLAEVVVPSRALRHGKSLELSLDDDAFRVWHDGALVLSDAAMTWEVPKVDGDLVLEVEATQALARTDLVLRETRGKHPDEVRLALTGAPLLLNHHLQATEAVWVTQSADSGFSNTAMVADLRAVLGDRLHAVDARRYRYDVWIQDEPELGTFTAPGQRMDLVLDSIRDRGLDNFPESLVTPGLTVDTWGEGFASSYDSFGNLEVTPPVEGWPFGRAYYGAVGNSGPDVGLRQGLEDQLVQGPFELDTTWLCVGHVDEFTSFVPDPSAPRGFRFLVADAREAYALIDALDPALPLPLYGRDLGYDSIGAVAADTALRSYNLGLQDDEIEPNIDRFRGAIGLTDDEIVRIPGLFERVGGCGAAALIPGTVNVLVADVGAETHVFMADPFFRAALDDQSTDPFIDDVVARLPATVVPHFVDDWEVYHLGLGEVHCGINSQRTPYGEWWSDALATLEEAP